MIPELLEEWSPSEVSRPYWEAAARGELALQRCSGCGRFQHPPRPFCTGCGGEPTFVTVRGTGTVYSYTVVRRALLPELRAHVPYVLALVDLDEGPRLITIIRDVDPDHAAIGLAVRVAFEQVGQATLPVFRPTL